MKICFKIRSSWAVLKIVSDETEISEPDLPVWFSWVVANLSKFGFRRPKSESDIILDELRELRHLLCASFSVIILHALLKCAFVVAYGPLWTNEFDLLRTIWCVLYAWRSLVRVSCVICKKKSRIVETFSGSTILWCTTFLRFCVNCENFHDFCLVPISCARLLRRFVFSNGDGYAMTVTGDVATLTDDCGDRYFRYSARGSHLDLCYPYPIYTMMMYITRGLKFSYSFPF